MQLDDRIFINNTESKVIMIDDNVITIETPSCHWMLLMKSNMKFG